MSFGSSDSNHKKCRSKKQFEIQNRNFFIERKIFEPKRRREKRGEKWKS
jgi:hypothetical protein